MDKNEDLPLAGLCCKGDTLSSAHTVGGCSMNFENVVVVGGKRTTVGFYDSIRRLVTINHRTIADANTL